MTLLLLLACLGDDDSPPPDTGNAPDSAAEPDSGDTGDTGLDDDSGDDDTGGDDTDPPGPDADGDGAVDAAAGGDDCDDGDSRVYPGAPEWCDAEDWNCDGDPYDGRACGELQDLGVLADGTWDGDTGFDWQFAGRFLGDLDGDGTDDVALEGTGISAETKGAYGGVFYVPGGQPVSVGMSRAETAAAWWHGNYDNGTLGGPHPAGDVDADGNPDLWLLGCDGIGAAALVLGPPERWGTDEDFTDAADVVWYGEAYRDSFASFEAATDVDFDQDGFDDAAFFSQADPEYESEGAVYLVRGREGLAETQARAVADEIRITCETPYDIAAGDITGDGLPDLIVGLSRRQIRILDGTDLPGADGTDCTVLAGTTVVTDTEDSSLGHGVAIVGDWSGDGIVDWATGDRIRSVDFTWEGAVYLMPGAPDATRAGEVSADDASYASFLGGTYRFTLGSANLEALSDLDGDGLAEVGTARLTDYLGEERLSALVLPSGDYAGLNQPLPDRTLVLAGGEGEGVAYIAPSAGDFDGDGLNDILTGSGYWRNPLGREYLVFGGEIPWDDPDAW